PDGDLGRAVAVLLHPPAHRGGPQQDLGVGGRAGDPEAAAQRGHRLVEGLLQASLGLGGGEGVDGRLAPDRVEDEIAGQRRGVVGGGGDGALAGGRLAPLAPALDPARPDPLGRRRGGGGRGGRARAGRDGRGRGGRG